jgi:transcriptional regulator with XRE-family HTH domain
MATEYGKRLKQARTNAGLTQEAASKKTGISQSTISTAERLGNGSAENHAYAIAYGVSPIWLATGDGPMHYEAGAVSVESPSPTVAVALDAIEAACEKLDQEQRKELGSLLAMFAANPRKSIKQVILETLCSVQNKTTEQNTHSYYKNQDKKLKKG